MRCLLLTLTVTACLPATISAQPSAEGVDQPRDPAAEADAAARRSLRQRPAKPAPPTLAFGPPSSIPAHEPQPPSPRANVTKNVGHGGRAFGGALGGSLVGAGLGTLCVMAVAAVTDSDDIGLALVTGSTCYGFGVSAVIMEAGKHPGGRGSFGATLGGAAVGTVAGYGLIFGVLDDNEESKGTIAAILVSYLGLPIAGSLVGYWASHRHDTDDTLTVGPAVVGPAQAPGLAVSGRF